MKTMAEEMSMFENEDLPPHKREGYAERAYEQADMLRKEQRENYYDENSKLRETIKMLQWYNKEAQEAIERERLKVRKLTKELNLLKQEK
jgi:hypothetical protein